jgi:glycosyltransferase
MPLVAQTIDSVLMQDYAQLEYVVVDGGSNDGTVEVIRSRQHGITRWISEHDEGIADAFNRGIALATGDYLLFLNADDALARADALTQIARAISTNGWPTFLYGDCDVLDRTSDAVLYRASIRFSHAGLLRGRMPPHPSLFAKRSYFEQYGNFDTQFRLAMDFEWFLRGILNEQIVHAPVLVTNVRTGGVSTQHQRRAIDEIVRALRKNGHIQTGWDEFRLRGYFSGRQGAKVALEKLGLYQMFAGIRSQIAEKKQR